MFWQNLAPVSTADRTHAPKLSKAIDQHSDSYEAFEDKSSKALLGIQGSGWGWLVKDRESGRFAIVTTREQDLVAATETPIFGVDMWEHAFYLQYQNVKADYVKNIWKVINWHTVEERYLGGRNDALAILKASL